MDTLERSDPTGTEETNRSVMLRFLEATEQGDIDAYAELVVPDLMVGAPFPPADFRAQWADRQNG